jgi:hypothetical protein
VALVNCPKCSAALKIADGSTAAIRCPKCKNVFRPPASQPAFEVVNEEPAPPPPKAPPRAVPKPIAKPVARPASEFEVVDEPAPPKKKRVVVDLDDEDDRPRKRRRVEEEDEEDNRPRGRRRDDDEDEEDEEDDRPRKKKKRRRDYDDDDDRRRSVGPAKTGLLLLSISLWIYGGAVALVAFFMLLGWLGLGLGYFMFVIAGIAGLANWIVAIVGISFCIANPRVRGLAIATMCVAAAHLGLTFYDATDKSTTKTSETIRIGNGTQTTERTERTGGRLHFLMQGVALSGYSSRLQSIGERLQKNPRDEAASKDAQEVVKDLQEAGKSWENPGLYWVDFVTMLPLFDGILDELVYDSKHLSGRVVSLLAGACELARLILIVLLVGAVARAGRAGAAAGKSQAALVGVCVAAGACVIVSFVMSLIVHEGKPSLSTLRHLLMVVLILLYLAHAAMALVSALVAQVAKSDVD